MVLQKKLRLLSHQRLCQLILKTTKHTKLHDAHVAGRLEAGPTVVHIAGQGVEVTADPGPDLHIITRAGHRPTAGQTLKTPRKQVATRIIH